MKKIINKSYEKQLHKILKTYNSILVKSKNIPTLADKNIIIVENMDGMINAQIETKKPIIYFEETKSASFILIDGTESYIYILKENINTDAQIESMINKIETTRSAFLKEILSKIERILLNGNTEDETKNNEVKDTKKKKNDVKSRKNKT